MLLLKYHLKIFLRILLIFTSGVASRKFGFTKQTITVNFAQLTTSQATTGVPNPSKPLNQAFASLFKDFIQTKSINLYNKTKKFSSYSLLDETVQLQLRKDTKIIHKNLSGILDETAKRLSETLQKKSIITNSLSQTAENAFIEYKFNLELVNTSAKHIYYDSKSPKTFCDVSDILKRNVSLIDTYFHYWNLSNQNSFKNEYYRKDELTVHERQRMNEIFWDIDCLNQTKNKNFEPVEKTNFLQSTVHVPSNVFKQTLVINMTAFWTESLNKQFKINNQNNKDLNWQYFCSFFGLYRQYPGAYWTVPSREDFFDCRLQSWYVNAASSSKDIIILLDTSGSMTGIKLEIAKKLIQLLFHTFTDNDFLNVITYSDVINFLVPKFTDQFIQASKSNKKTFNNALKDFKNTSQQGNLEQALVKAFLLFNDSSLDKNGCNKIIMVVTDGQQDSVKDVFDKHNIKKETRVFSFKIGRDIKDIDEVRKMACEYSNGEFFHVSLTDINEHVSKYVAVLSRPMAMMGIHETHWSNVFKGYLDNQLKISVSMPAFIRQDSLLDLMDSIDRSTDYSESLYEIDKILTENNQLNNAASVILNRQILLGVVGIDVPVLPLIFNTSLRFQMNAGIYLIMLDSNGYVVYHPSLKAETSGKEINSFTGAAYNIDLDQFEIPIENYKGFQSLEHDMIDRKAGQKSILIWKKCGNRLIKLYTSYLFVPVEKTPFVIALASPISYGKYRLKFNYGFDEKFYDQKLIDLLKGSIVNNAIQLAGCSYDIKGLIYDLLFDDKSDGCASKVLLKEPEQLVALKLDLIMYESIYKRIDYTLFLNEADSVRSIFYGSYSGVEFYFPIKYSRLLYPLVDKNEEEMFSFEKSYFLKAVEFSDYLRNELKIDEPFVHFKLNDTDNQDGGLTASIVIWLERIPVVVANVVYESAFVEGFLFNDQFKSRDGLIYENLCLDKNEVTCYLLDENAIVIGNNFGKKEDRGNPFYLINPWVMLELEASGHYELIIPGSKLEDCKPFSNYASGSAKISSFISFVFEIYKLVTYSGLLTIINLMWFQIEAFSNSKLSLIKNIELNYESDVLYRNSHCSNFGIYNLNLNEWQKTNNSEMRTWCHKDFNHSKNFIVGHLEKSNLLIVIIESNQINRNCESIMSLIEKKRSNKVKKIINRNNLNRYRNRMNNKPCYDFNANESAMFRCNYALSNFNSNYYLIPIPIIILHVLF